MVRFPEAERDFKILQSIQTGFGGHPASYSRSTGMISPGIKLPGCKINLNRVPTQKMHGAIPSLPRIPS
jgi:hypothetical protein